MVNLICAGKDSGRVEKQFFVDGRPSVGPNPVLDSQPCNGLSLSCFADQGSNPTKHKLLPPPPPPNWYPSTRGGGRGLKMEKNHLGIILSCKIMILQGVRHPISCLGVCCVNDSRKEGCMASEPALDLTTSLLGYFMANSPATRAPGQDSAPSAPSWGQMLGAPPIMLGAPMGSEGNQPHTV